MKIELIIPSAEEMRIKTEPQREQEKLKRLARKKEININAQVMLIKVWKDILYCLDHPTGTNNTFYSFHTKYYDEKLDRDVAEKCFSFVLEGLEKAGYDVEYHIYSKAWYTQTKGKFAYLTIKWA